MSNELVNKKRMISQSISLMNELDGRTLSEAISYLQDLSNRYSKSNLSVDYNADSDGYILNLHFLREETDKEYQNRIRVETAAKARRDKEIARQRESIEKRERKLLQKLKAKYES